MYEIIQASVAEQFYSMHENDKLIDQLQSENENLRNLLSLNDVFHNQMSIKEIEGTLRDYEKEQEEFEYEKMQIDNLKKLQELENIRHQLTSTIEDELRHEFEEKFMKLAQETAELVRNKQEKRHSYRDEGVQIIFDSEED